MTTPATQTSGAPAADPTTAGTSGQAPNAGQSGDSGQPGNPPPAQNPNGSQGTQGQQAGSDNKGDQPGQQATLVKYELKPQEGFTIDPKTIDALTPIFNELKLDNPGAQKLADAYAPILKAQMESAVAEAVAAHQAAETKKFEDLKASWKQEALKELGADHEAEMATAAKARDRLTPKEVVELLDAAGLSENIHVIKWMKSLGSRISEGGLVEGQNRAPQGATAQTMFPSMSNP